MSYLRRALDDVLDDIFPAARAVAIDGARAVGKTETAQRRVHRVIRLDDPAVAAAVAAGPSEYLDGAPTVLLDEWQELPEVWDRVRRRVDARTDTSYLLTGSATPRPGATTHTGAGRILRLHMRPMSIRERQVVPGGVALDHLLEGGAAVSGTTDVTLRTYVEEICASGLPEVHAAGSRLRRHLLDSYLTGILDRELLQAGTTVRHPESLRAWLTSYAAASSTTTTYTSILNAATAGDTDKPARNTTAAYRDALTQIWILDPVPAWLPALTPLPRLKVGPKHQLADPALAARLLGATSATLLSGAPGAGELLGQLFESLATLSVRTEALRADARVMHLRTRDGGHEIDLIVEDPHGRVVAFEVKLTQAVNDKDVRHLLWLKRRIGDRLSEMVVITAGPYAHRRPDGVIVLPLALLG